VSTAAVSIAGSNILPTFVLVKVEFILSLQIRSYSIQLIADYSNHDKC
jgi:hypothetical protein